MDAIGDEVETGAAAHGDRCPGLIGEHEDWRVVRGLSPPHPFQVSSGQGPRRGPNMLRPMIHAPILLNPRSAKSLSMPVVPPSLLNICRNVRVAKAHSCNATPPMPIGLSRS